MLAAVGSPAVLLVSTSALVGRRSVAIHGSVDLGVVQCDLLGSCYALWVVPGFDGSLGLGPDAVGLLGLAFCARRPGAVRL